MAHERDAVARATWWAETAPLDPASLVFLDETRTHTATTWSRARAPRGERAVGVVPRNHGPNVTLLATLTPTGIDAPYVQEGAADRALFTAYVAHVLVPTLHPGQPVILDNRNVHQGHQIRAQIEAAGCQLRFLPTYSPDFNPIEQAFAKIKTSLRRQAARTFEDLVVAIREAIDAVTPVDARGCFTHCGYPLPAQLR